MRRRMARSAGSAERRAQRRYDDGIREGRREEREEIRKLVRAWLVGKDEATRQELEEVLRR